MGKRKSKHKGEPKISRRKTETERSLQHQDVEDEIDAFHNQRNIIPLDADNAPNGSDESDYEEPVFVNQDIDEDLDLDEDEDEEDGNYDHEDSRLVAKIVKQQKFLRAKYGGVDDDVVAEEDEEEEKRLGWGGRKARYHGGDNRDIELKSSDDEALKEEEDEILRMQKERAKFLSMEDYGIDDMVEDDAKKELTFEEISAKGVIRTKPSHNLSVVDGTESYIEVEKDQNSMSIEEQMDVLYRSAPELIGLLSELKVSFDELETNLNPLLNQVSDGVKLSGGMSYLKMKQLLYLSYCQSIAFYLLLKSEGCSVRDHPIIARLVEIKELIDKTKDLDVNLPSNVEELVRNYFNCTKGETTVQDEDMRLIPSEKILDSSENAEAVDSLERMSPPPNNELDKEKNRHQDTEIGVISSEMLKYRSALEAKLKKSNLLNITPNNHAKKREALKPLDSRFQTINDFDDDVLCGENQLANGNANNVKVSQYVSTKQNRQKIISGDDDIPKRDDIGERRKKHELRVLASAGVDEQEPEIPTNVEPTKNIQDQDESDGSDDFYAQVKQQRAQKLAAKAEIYNRTSGVPSLPETVDGKRTISRQIDKNRGLTRARNKLTKNPRKKYRTKHDTAHKRRKGQVRDVKKPFGPYGGEASGINAGISRSVRF